jgi:DNA-binding MarR family transcriptional regulator/GNAT superfamily N-acetyltransferase
MESQLQHSVKTIREFNRYYTRKIGVLNEGLLDSPFTLTEARLFFEIGSHDDITAAILGQQLGLDAGYLSRTLNALEAQGLIQKRLSQQDRRQRLINLTEDGEQAFALLDSRSSDEIAAMINDLNPEQVGKLTGAMSSIEQILDPDDEKKGMVYIRHNQAGDMGWVIQQHALVYSREYGWDKTFEAFVAEICAGFIKNFDAQKERCWIAEKDGQRVGSIFCVNVGDGIAKLRMLIVTREARGLGLGSRLVEECIRFAKGAGYHKMVLWTNDILVEARHIYEKYGFKLVEEEKHHSFGQALVGQNWELLL